MKLPIQSLPVQRTINTQSIAMSSQLQPSSVQECTNCINAALASGNGLTQAMNACRRLGACPP
jgi:hypothetical protein